MDINQLLDQDEQEVVSSKKKIIYVDSDGEEVQSEEGEDIQDASPSPSPNPYIHPLVRPHEQDIDYPEGMSEDKKQFIGVP